MRTVIVCGGRDYADYDAVERVLNRFQPERIFEGGAKGADTLARLWAVRHDVRCVTFKADWDRHGKAAGPLRNRAMLLEVPVAGVIAFPGGSGTADMIRQAEAAGVPVYRVGGGR